jgi:hypothetical protein
MSESPPAAESATETTDIPNGTNAGGSASESTELPAAVPGLPTNDNAAPQLQETSCACNKSKCLKLYCDCFSRGNRCGDNCECKECCNDGQHDQERKKAIRAVLDRKPDAFDDEIKQQVEWVADEKPAASGKKRGRPRGTINKNKSIILNPDIKRARGRPRKDTADLPVGPLTAPPDPIAFASNDYPELAIDPSQDYSHLASSFTRPLFPPSDPPTSKPLQIAYSHQAAAQHARQTAQSKKNSVFDEYKRIRDKYIEKKLELSLANDEVEKCNKEEGAWTKKVFDLELVEPCDWNEKLEMLRKYKEANDKLPPKNPSRCEEGDEKELAKWLERMRGNKVCFVCFSEYYVSSLCKVF